MKLYPMVYPKIPGKPFLFFLDPIQIPPWWILKTHRECYLFKYLPPSDSDPTSVLTGMSMYLCLSFSFKIVVLWAQGWILFCSEAYAFSKCSMFVEWMDEQAVMRNNTFSYYVALKPLLVACRFGGGTQISHWKGQIDVRLIEIHGIVIWHWTPSKVLLVSPIPYGPFWRSPNSLKLPVTLFTWEGRRGESHIRSNLASYL